MTSNPSFQDSKPLGLETETNKSTALTAAPPPDFLILRSGSQSPERFLNGSLEDAKATAARQVRNSNGSLKRVFVYQLVFCEQHVSSSETLDLEGIKVLFAATQKEALGDQA